ncbi:hypothetical protein OIE66_16990 [Nonomuraea sp. NBC_01738]|nr:hypothetical protein OIE66_16990 [Nonomuraea sp. NBC_01738]
MRTTYQPDEPPLELTVGHLRRIREAVDQIGDQAGSHAFDDFVICRLDG